MAVSLDRGRKVSGADEAGEWLGRPLGAAVRATRTEMGLTRERLAAQAA